MSKQKKNTGMSDRERRRQRRVRSQIMAYVTLAVLIIGAGTGLFFAGKYATEKIADKRQEKELEEELAAMAEAESEAALAETEEAETEETVEEYSEDDLLDEMVDASIAEMPLEDRVAGLFLTTPEALTGTDNVTRAGEGTEKALAQYPVAGLVYAPSNVKSAEQFTQMLTDTIPKSKYPLFLIMGDTAEPLTEDLSVYGVNMEFDGQAEDGAVFRTRPLASLLGDASEEGIATVRAEGEEDAIADACLAAWQGGADMLYVPEHFQAAYEGLLAKIQESPELENAVTASLENICRIKYRNRLEG